ncbi:MAG: hypothetical protein ACPLPS_09225 [bacterium]
MKASLLPISNLEEFKLKMEEIKEESFTLIAEDWEEGIILKPNCSPKDAIEMISTLENKYGSTFLLLAFNKNKELFWRFDEGFYVEIGENGEYDVRQRDFFLERDSSRFPGCSAFNGFRKAKLQEISQKGKVIYIKMEELI